MFNVLIVLVFFSRVFTFASTCRVLFVHGFLSLFIYMYMVFLSLVLVLKNELELSQFWVWISI